MRNRSRQEADWTPAGAATRWEGTWGWTVVDREVAGWAGAHPWHQEAGDRRRAQCPGAPPRPGLGGRSGPLVILAGCPAIFHSMVDPSGPVTGGRAGRTGWHGPSPPVGPGTSSQECLLVPSHLRVLRPGLPWSWSPGLAPWRPRCLTDGTLLGARGCPWLKPACHGAAPAAGRHAHAALASLLTVCLALHPLMSAGAAGLG